MVTELQSGRSISIDLRHSSPIFCSGFGDNRRAHGWPPAMPGRGVHHDRRGGGVDRGVGTVEVGEDWQGGRRRRTDRPPRTAQPSVRPARASPRLPVRGGPVPTMATPAWPAGRRADLARRPHPEVGRVAGAASRSSIHAVMNASARHDRSRPLGPLCPPCISVRSSTAVAGDSDRMRATHFAGS